MGRKSRLAVTSISSLILHITSIVSGFILPKLLISTYGSEINGLVNSIAQFLYVIAFLELGVGAVVQSALYKPLAEKDELQTSRIVASANKFFRTIAYILIAYILVLIIFYPVIIDAGFSFIYTATLILSMSLSYFAEYYFGIVERLLLTADQKGYVQYNAHTITLILNTLACTILIRSGAGIQIVKLAASVIFILRPLFLRCYVDRHYSIRRDIQYTEEPIGQKWNGIAQHIAAVILDQTDPIVLTLFSTLSNVSVYSVYHLVVYGVKNLFISLTSGIQALFGELWAKEEFDELKETFSWAEWAGHTGVTLIFGCTASLIVPFVRVYTDGITDADYIVPVFGFLITLANAMHCLNLPYNIMILAGGHYKQTQRNYLIAAAGNIMISVITVRIWGLIGVAIGTLAAMVYQTLWMAWYDSRNFFCTSMGTFFKHLAIDIISFAIAFRLASLLPFETISYFSWILLAVKAFFIWFGIVLGMNVLFYRKFTSRLFHMITNRLPHHTP